MRLDLRRQGRWPTQRKTCSRDRSVSPSVPPAFVFGAALRAGLALGESLFQGEPDAGTVLHDRRVDLVALVGREVGRPLAYDTDPVHRRRACLCKAPLGVLVRLDGESA